MSNNFYNGRKWIHSPNDLPPGEHYAILEFSSITIPGDERSRTHPGHGYPEHSENKTDVIVFQDFTSWKKEIEERSAQTSYHRDNWIPVVIRRAAVTTTVSVTVK